MEHQKVQKALEMVLLPLKISTETHQIAPRSKVKSKKWRALPPCRFTSLEGFWKHSTSLQAGLRVPAHVILEAQYQLAGWTQSAST